MLDKKYTLNINKRRLSLTDKLSDMEIQKINNNIDNFITPYTDKFYQDIYQDIIKNYNATNITFYVDIVKIVNSDDDDLLYNAISFLRKIPEYINLDRQDQKEILNAIIKNATLNDIINSINNVMIKYFNRIYETYFIHKIDNNFYLLKVFE